MPDKEVACPTNDLEPNSLTVSRGALIRRPFNLKDIDFSNSYLDGIAINQTGLAIVAATSGFGGGASIFGQHPPRQNKAARASSKLIRRKPKRQKRENISLIPTDRYYLVSITHQPIPLAVPPGATSINVTALNDRGISVGTAELGPGGAFKPFYWDAQGNPHPMQSNDSAGDIYPLDINNAGGVVGYELGMVGQSGQTGVLWSSLDGPMSDVNSHLPPNFDYRVLVLYSIDDDFTMAATGVGRSLAFFYFGLQPR